MPRRNRRHVLHVVHRLGDGGADRALTRLANAGLAAARQSIYVMDGGGPLYEPLARGVRVTAGAGVHEPLAAHLARLTGAVRRVDVVHGWVSSATPLAAAAAAALGVPLVLRQPTNLPKVLAYDPHTIDVRALGVPFRQASRVVVPSPVLVDGTRSTYGVQAIAVIPNAVDAPSATWHRPAGPGFEAVFAGRLIPSKAPMLVVDALCRLPADVPWRLRVFGDGPLGPALAARLDRDGLRDRVVLAGFASDWVSAAARADVFVLPTRYEGMCNTLLEAAAAGVPIVTTDIPENSFLLRHEHEALLVPPDDVAALAAALLRLARERDLGAALGAHARGVTGRFALAHMVDAYDSLYDTL